MVAGPPAFMGAWKWRKHHARR
jgi:hypothetical protein